MFESQLTVLLNKSWRRLARCKDRPLSRHCWARTISRIRQWQKPTKNDSKVKPLNPEASRKIIHFYQHLRTDTGKTLFTLQPFSVSSAKTDYKEALEEIAEVAFCHDAGATNDVAYAHAAHNALLYLKITPKKA
ncbi:hypothetical protein LSAT2_025765 [Lamellibrachia satsuma]|nr:hypothetical protein LSAT2_025765 [Lamellibrachia satsuma]